MITTEQLKEFKAIYKKEFGKDISDKDALDSATSLVDMMRLVYKPITKKDYEKYSKPISDKTNLSGRADQEMPKANL